MYLCRELRSLDVGRLRGFVVLLSRRGITLARHTRLGSTTGLVASLSLKILTGSEAGEAVALDQPGNVRSPAGLRRRLEAPVSWPLFAVAKMSMPHLPKAVKGV